MSKKLEDRWVRLTREYGLPKRTARSIFNDIAARYNEPHRHYHTLQHLEDAFTHYRKVEHMMMDPDMVAFALFFHDIIYDPQSRYNEEDSAQYAETILRRIPQLSRRHVNHIMYMILATKSHDNPYKDRDTRYLLDIDLAILASDNQQYRAYADNIRREFNHIASDKDFMRARRDKMLIPFSERQIYTTKYFKKRYEQKAQENIRREIERINSKLSI